jgi:hypothetical protein
MARPSAHTPEVAAEICDRIAGGESLRRICEDEHLPSMSTVCLWVVDNREQFSEQYARARRAQGTLMADQIAEIADTGSGDTARDRLRVDTRKWYLSKVLPKLYGDKVEVEHSGTPEIVVRVID